MTEKIHRTIAVYGMLAAALAISPSTCKKSERTKTANSVDKTEARPAGSARPADRPPGKVETPVKRATLKPAARPKTRAAVYVPKDLDDCFKELKKKLPAAEIQKMKAGKEKDMIRYHHGLGTWMRNNWGLWGGSRLRTYFVKLGLRHPDDMSSTILDSFWRHLNGKPIKLKEQVKRYQAYWKRMKKKHAKKKSR
jgi:hypothetical protein